MILSSLVLSTSSGSSRRTQAIPTLTNIFSRVSLLSSGTHPRLEIQPYHPHSRHSLGSSSRLGRTHCRLLSKPCSDHSLSSYSLTSTVRTSTNSHLSHRSRSSRIHPLRLPTSCSDARPSYTRSPRRLPRAATLPAHSGCLDAEGQHPRFGQATEGLPDTRLSAYRGEQPAFERVWCYSDAAQVQSERRVGLRAPPSGVPISAAVRLPDFLLHHIVF